jgi:hypothetical protein
VPYTFDGRVMPRLDFVSRRTRNRIIILLSSFIIITISSCSSVPLSTITLPREFKLDAERSWLGIDIMSAAGQHHGVFELNQESVELREIPAGIFSDSEHVISYLLSLTQSSQVEFGDLQHFTSKAAAEDVNIRVVPKLESFPEDATSVEVSVDLQLSESRGFFTLLDAAQLPLGKLVKSDKG